ncbi:MFS transporter [Exilibacterium tricleocarpae]|uniref:MFS transporter n=1 Tax=Exilibacterium tricleocarpae TaxID=2591008 RepID=A0A545SRU0_9GAMM|nr:MFS transporter [Exilibacterium tricleocarpae]TQV67682.1 MFS transporter [Exilibacterium tricleocarpae]
MSALPYWRLSSFYFCYFAVVGTLVPFWGLYLQAQGFSPQAIGGIGAVLMVTKVIAPNIWGWLADRSGRRLGIIRWGGFCACVCFLGVFLQPGLAGMLMIVTAYSFFWNAVLAQFEVITLGYLGKQAHRYGQIRLWGSVGFVVVVAGLGWLFDHLSVSYLPFFVLTFLLLIWICSLTLAEPARPASTVSERGFLQIVKQPPVLCFLLAGFFLQISHGSYYTFFSLYLEEFGYRRVSIGGLWALGVMAEMAIFFVMYRLIPRFGLRRLFLFSLVLAALRWWLVTYFVNSVALLLFAQVLHAFTFGVAHAVAIELVRIFFGAKNQGQGQALYSATSFGAGGAVGAALSGTLWAVNPQLPFVMSIFAALVALLFAWFVVITDS